MKYSKRRIIRIIEDLKLHNALELVLWTAAKDYPMIWLKPWCGMRTVVSIGTAESVLRWIEDGRIRRIRGVRYGLPQQKRITASKPNVIYTTFKE